MLSDRQIRRVTEQRVVVIDEVNIANNHISARDQYGTTLMLSFDSSQPVVVIPKQGESWIVERYNTTWKLKQRQQSGDSNINADIVVQGDTVTINADDSVNINGTTVLVNGQTILTGSISTPSMYSSPISIPILMGAANSYQGFGFTNVRVEPAARFNAVRTNQSGSHTAALNDYFTFYVELGPKGSVWGILTSFLTRTNGGVYTFSMASVTDTNGALSDTQPAPYRSLSSNVDTYFSSTTDSFFNGYPMQFVIGGNPGDVYTSESRDTFNRWVINGGPGIYAIKVAVTSKNASSTGYQCDISGIAFVRLNEAGYLGGF